MATQPQRPAAREQARRDHDGHPVAWVDRATPSPIARPTPRRISSCVAAEVVARWPRCGSDSVSAEVCDRAPCPVLVARHARITHVLLAHDGSGPARAAEELVSGCSAFGGVPVTLVSAIPPKDEWGLDPRVLARREVAAGIDAAREAARDRMTEVQSAAASRLREAGHPVTGVVRDGPPANVILEEADAVRRGPHRHGHACPPWAGPYTRWECRQEGPAPRGGLRPGRPGSLSIPFLPCRCDPPPVASWTRPLGPGTRPPDHVIRDLT